MYYIECAYDDIFESCITTSLRLSDVAFQLSLPLRLVCRVYQLLLAMLIQEYLLIMWSMRKIFFTVERNLVVKTMFTVQDLPGTHGCFLFHGGDFVL